MNISLDSKFVCEYNAGRTAKIWGSIDKVTYNSWVSCNLAGSLLCRVLPLGGSTCHLPTHNWLFLLDASSIFSVFSLPLSAITSSSTCDYNVKTTYLVIKPKVENEQTVNWLGPAINSCHGRRGYLNSRFYYNTIITIQYKYLYSAQDRQWIEGAAVSEPGHVL